MTQRDDHLKTDHGRGQLADETGRCPLEQSIKAGPHQSESNHITRQIEAHCRIGL